MTHAEIDELEGRELDAAVAERVMGKRRSDIFPNGYSRDTDTTLPRVNTSLRYSDGTDMNAMWSVVSKMQERFPSLRFTFFSECRGENYHASFLSTLTWKHSSHSFHQEAETAICRASLYAYLTEQGTPDA